MTLQSMTSTHQGPLPEAPQALPRCITVVGAGLIGGSVALACARRWPDVRLAVTDRDAHAARVLALRLGISPSSGVAAAVQGADIVVLAVPPHALAEVTAQVLRSCPSHCVVTDVGSIKQPLVSWAATLAPLDQARLVPAHPIAGGTAAGSAGSDASMFVDRAVILCPLPTSAPSAVAQVNALWSALGARVYQLDAAEHDRLYAMLSHLPHLIAFSYVDAVAAACPAPQVASLGGASMRDFARIGRAHPSLWADICLGNRIHVLNALAQFERSLAALRNGLERNDRDGLERALAATASRHVELFPPASA